MDLRKVPVDSIEVPQNYIPTLHRKNTCEAIKFTGVILPPVVRESEGKFVLVDGLERYECAKKLGYREIEVLVVDNEKSDILRLALNYVRGKVCGIDVLLYTHQLVLAYGQTALSIILGRSVNTIDKYYRAANRLINLGITGEIIEKLRSACYPVRRIVSCAFDIDSLDALVSCIERKPKAPTKTKLPVEAIATAERIMRDPDAQAVFDLFTIYGPERFKEFLELVNLLKLSICPKIGNLLGKVDGDVYKALSKMCEIVAK